MFTFRNIDFGELLQPEARSKHKYTTYDLMANIVHDGEPMAGKGTYRVHILHKVECCALRLRGGGVGSKLFGISPLNQRENGWCFQNH